MEEGEADEEPAPVDTAALFEQLKNKFFQEETHLNDEDQLKELEDIEEEKRIKEVE